MISCLTESLENLISLLFGPIGNDCFNGSLLIDRGVNRHTKSTIMNDATYTCARFFVVEAGKDTAWIHTSARTTIAFGENAAGASKLLACGRRA